MLGRDRLKEHGNPGSHSPADTMSSQENELMGQATQCVRKFAPNGRKRMRRTDNGHITACKISNANPNEIIVSWSGDHIYSFDLARSPDATENKDGVTETHGKGHVKGKMKESADRKRKRNHRNPSTSPGAARRSSISRQTSASANGDGDLSIRVRYENGQSEDIAMEDHLSLVPRATVEETREYGLNESQKRSLQIAKCVVKVRLKIFSLDAQSRASMESGALDYTDFTPQMTSALGLAASCLPDMDEIIGFWGYPMDPDREDVLLQQTLRSNREGSRRFVQAAGTLARIIGGRLQTTGSGSSHALSLFQRMDPTPQVGPHASRTRRFSYEFLKAITLWLDGGTQALLQGFKRPQKQRLDDSRFPVPEDGQLSCIQDDIIPFLLRLAQEKSILNIDTSRFERDEDRMIFETETTAVIAFSHAVRMSLEDLDRTAVPPIAISLAEDLDIRQDRNAAVRFWGFKVGRSLLMNAAQGINFQFVDLAFGGLGKSPVDEGRVQENIDLDEMDDVVESIGLMKRSTEPTVLNDQGSIHESYDDGVDGDLRSAPSITSREPAAEIEDIGSDADVVLMEDIHNEIAHHMGEGYENNEDSDNLEDDDDEDDEDDDDGELTAEERQLLFQSASDRGKLRESVEKNVACSSHTHVYRGHCNVKTVKDVNFFGLQDEYVVSGSDSGHLFIWDKKTSELVNILKGDSEVVNVIQGILTEFIGCSQLIISV